MPRFCIVSPPYPLAGGGVGGVVGAGEAATGWAHRTDEEAHRAYFLVTGGPA